MPADASSVRDPLRLGLAAHLSAWLLVGLAAFLRAGEAWFPAAPGARLGAALVLGGLALAAWPRATRGLWLWTVHSLSLAALALVCLELLLTVLHAGREEPSRYPFPYRMHGFAPERRAADNRHRASTNDAGLREPSAIAIPKPSGTFRILVLGGSAIFGIGAEDGDSAPDQLERMLAGARRPPGVGRIGS
jgi:hypothetical protein